MTMLDFYKLSIGESLKLRDKVIVEGTRVGTVFNRETYRNNDLIEYQGNVFQIDSYLGIVDIKEVFV